MMSNAFTVAMALSLSLPLILTAPAAAAQDVYDTEVLSRHADVERQRNLKRATVGRNQPWGWNGGRQGGQATSRRASAQTICANNRAMIQRGSTDAKVLQLRALCERRGY